MTSIPSTQIRCSLLLNKWRENLTLTNRERRQLSNELQDLDLQIARLNQKRLRLVVFGRVGVGKSSVLNALLKKECFTTDVAHGCTVASKSVEWNQNIQSVNSIDLVDTPGIDEVAGIDREKIAEKEAMKADLVLLILDSDITRIELQALKRLLKAGKPVVLVLNRCDQWQPKEQKEIVKSIRNRLPKNAQNIQIETVSAAPRNVQLTTNRRVRSYQCKAKVQSLIEFLTKVLSQQAGLLASLNSLQQADDFYQSLKLGRIKRNKETAQGLIGKYAALKASGVAVNPFLMVDFAGGMACDAALVMQLSKLYGLQLGGQAARELIRRLSIYNSFLGGVQICIQLSLGIFRQLLFLATPITGGISIICSAFIAIAQAAIAVQTTKVIGRNAAKVLFNRSQHREIQPAAILKRLAVINPVAQKWLAHWSRTNIEEVNKLNGLLP